jgi:hypothetical protein
MVGPEDGEGEESFDFVVCTPGWLEAEYGRQAVIVVRHHVLVFDYDFPRIRRRLEDLVAKARGQTWAELASSLARYGRWEFEEYTPPRRQLLLCTTTIRTVQASSRSSRRRGR